MTKTSPQFTDSSQIYDAITNILTELKDNGYVNLQTGAVESSCDAYKLRFLYLKLCNVRPSDTPESPC